MKTAMILDYPSGLKNAHWNTLHFIRKIKNTKFENSKLIGVDFTESDLTESVFSDCDLMRTIFNNTILEKADFRTSFNFSIDPERNRIRKAKFSLSGITGLLDKYDIEIEEKY